VDCRHNFIHSGNTIIHSDGREIFDAVRSIHDASHPRAKPLRRSSLDLQTLRWPTSSASARRGSASITPRRGSRTLADLLIAQALMRRAASGSGRRFPVALPSPAELANRVAMLDHMAQGRLISASRERTAERLGDVPCRRQFRAASRDDARALDIIPTVTENEPFDYTASIGSVADRAAAAHAARAHQAVPEALSRSASPAQQGLGDAEAGRRAWLPADEPQPQPNYVASHWSRSRKPRRSGARRAAPIAARP